MTIESVDWEVEFERLKQAFGVKVECEPRREGNYISLEEKGADGERLRLYDGFGLRAGYSLLSKTIHYCLFSDDSHTSITLGNGVMDVFASDGHLPEFDTSSLPLAKGLFCLGFLTPEIETELRVDVSAHQKIEWSLEYAKRLEVTR